MNRAGFFIRLAAQLIDAPVLLVIFFGVAWLVVETMGEPGSAAEEAWQDRVMLLAAIPFVLAYTGFEVFAGATPGKMLLRLRIVNLDGTPAPTSRLVLRWSTKYMPQIFALFEAATAVPAFTALYRLTSFVITIGCLAVLRKSRLAWHDEWAWTSVVRLERAEAPAFEPVVPAAARAPGEATNHPTGEGRA